LAASGTREVLVAVDVGTSSTRVRLLAPDGAEVDAAACQTRVVADTPGFAELDADALWGDVARLIGGLVRESLAVRGVGVTAQLGTMLLDEKGRPAARAILWADTRARAEAEELAGRFGSESMRIAGRRLTPELLAPRLAWLRRHSADLLSRTAKVASLKDFLVLKLTGRLVTDETHASYSGAFDVDRRRWSEALAAALGIDRALLPPVAGASEKAGEVTAAAAAETGLPAGTPVAVGCPDGTAGTVGAGAVRASVTVDVAGTTDTVLHIVARPLRDSEGALIVNAHAAPGLWSVGGPTGLTGGAVAWLTQVLGLADRADAVLAEALATIPPGAGGLAFHGALTGSRFPGWRSGERGLLAGLDLSHGPLHLIRAALEGAAFTVASGLDVYRRCGCVVGEVIVVGGLAASREALQLRADCLGVPVVRLDKQEASSVGIAMLAGVCGGVFRDLQEATDAMVVRAGRMEPEPSAASALGTAYARWKSLSAGMTDGRKGR
jgi:sugar (pentulose or hexulose) kinase